MNSHQRRIERRQNSRRWPLFHQLIAGIRPDFKYLTDEQKREILKKNLAKMSKIDDFCFNFEPPLTEGSKICCLKCQVYSSYEDWYANPYSYCETCGGHGFMICPECQEEYDQIECCNKVFKTVAGVENASG